LLNSRCWYVPLFLKKLNFLFWNTSNRYFKTKTLQYYNSIFCTLPLLFWNVTLPLTLHKLRHLLKSKTSLNHKILIHKQLLRPEMTYGVQVRGATKISNLKILQSFQSITLRLITNAPWYLSNRTLHHYRIT